MLRIFLARSISCLFISLLVNTACSKQVAEDDTDRETPQPATEKANSTASRTDEIKAAENNRSGPRLNDPKAPVVSNTRSIYLPSEKKLLVGNALSIERASATLRSDRFTEITQSFGRDTATSAEAQELTSLYRTVIEDTLADSGQLTDFQCGLSLCIGAIRTSGEAPYTAWTKKFGEDPRTPSYSFGDLTMDLGSNAYENRFVFSTDPAANSISIPSRPPPPIKRQ